jgi:hypothetical protein
MYLKALPRSFLLPAISLGAAVATAACAPTTKTAGIPPAPIALRWPDPAFLPERQCQGAYDPQEVERYLSRARLALTLPGTRSVALDRDGRCITVVVESVGGGRLAELVMRGVSVPRGAVLLRLESPERRG